MHSAAIDDQENTVDNTVLDNKDVQLVFTGSNTAPPGSAPLTEQLQKVMERLEEAERRANEANERAKRRECELEVMKIEKK